MNIALALILFVQDVDAKALDATLDEMASATDAASYLKARETVLAFGEAAVPLLKTRGAADQWTAAGWVRACAAEACRLRLTNAELVAVVDKPTGLDPAVYNKFRKPMPLCLRDFVHRGADTVPLLIERWRWTMSEYRFTDGNAGAREKDVYELAILETPGAVNDPRALQFLAGVIADTDRAANLRAQAAVSLGMCGGTAGLPTLTSFLDDARQPLSVREGCALGLGRVPDNAALDAVRTRLDAQGQDPAIMRALLGGLGNLGSSWGWESRGAAAKTLGDTIRKGCSDTLIAWLPKRPEDAGVIERALKLVAWKDGLDALKSIAADSAAPQAARDAASNVAATLSK